MKPNLFFDVPAAATVVFNPYHGMRGSQEEHRRPDRIHLVLQLEDADWTRVTQEAEDLAAEYFPKTKSHEFFLPHRNPRRDAPDGCVHAKMLERPVACGIRGARTAWTGDARDQMFAGVTGLFLLRGSAFESHYGGTVRGVTLAVTGVLLDPTSSPTILTELEAAAAERAHG